MPLVTVTKIKGALRLAALNAVAVRSGLRAGMALADARAMFPALIIHDADPAGDHETLLALHAWSQLFTPLAALDGDDGLILDITGAAHLVGGEALMIETLTKRLAQQGFEARAAIAATPAAAWALARYSQKERIAPDGLAEDKLAKFFGGLPLAALRIEDAMIAQLAQAGLRRVNDLLMRPRAPLSARFGPKLHARLDEVLGRARQPVSPIFEAPAFVAERRFAEGITNRDHLESTIAALAGDLCGLLARHGEGARRLCVTFFRVDGAVKYLEAGTSRPLRDPRGMARLFHERIETIGEDGLDTGYGFEVIRLAALQAERLDATQPGWDQNEDQAGLDDLIDRLGARFGLDRITRHLPVDRHWPEQAACVVSIANSPRGPSEIAPPAAKNPEGPAATPSLPGRPVRLLRRPEAIDTIATIPDGPPLQFRWRRVLHHVAAIEGPERIAPDWWTREKAPARDYFRAEDTAGQRFWLYREGLYRDTPHPRWFMHGLFA